MRDDRFRTLPQQIAATLLWEHCGDYRQAARYADRIASRQGEHSAEYTEAAAIIRRRKHTGELLDAASSTTY